MAQASLREREFWLSKRFSDSRKFPYGISRSGIFSNSQSLLLENKGCLLKALLDGNVTNPTAEDMAFIDAVEKGLFTFNSETLVWAKYKDYARKFHTLAERPKKAPAPVDIESNEYEILKDDDNWETGQAANSTYLEAS
jgi:uncharacterized protein YifE (UPF0438 family)